MRGEKELVGVGGGRIGFRGFVVPRLDPSAGATLEMVAGGSLHVDIVVNGQARGLGVGFRKRGVAGSSDRDYGVDGMLRKESSVPDSLTGLNGLLDALASGKPGVVLVCGEEPVAGLPGNARCCKGDPSKSYIGAEEGLTVPGGAFERFLGKAVSLGAEEAAGVGATNAEEVGAVCL